MLYVLGKTYKILPSELKNQSYEDIEFNHYITSIGFMEDRRNSLIGSLDGYNVKCSGNETIDQLEKMLKKAMEK